MNETKLGRPQRVTDPRTMQIQVKLNRAESERLEEASERTNLPKSELLLRGVFGRPHKGRKTYEGDPPLVVDWHTLMVKVLAGDEDAIKLAKMLTQETK